MTAYPRLFSPWTLGGMTLRNRAMQAAISSVYPSGGAVTDRLVDFYANRARGGAGLIVTEALASRRALEAPTRVRACDEVNLGSLTRWADAVERHDCRLLGQLYDPGRGRHHAGRHEAAIGASALPDDLSWSVPRALTAAEIASLLAELSETAHRLQRAGFSGVELSCGHGHLFHQFLSPQANRRTDEYGGSTENRTRLVRELCAAVRAACGARFILGVKLVGDDGVDGGIGSTETDAIAATLVATGHVNYLAMVRGAHHRTLEAHVPDYTYPPLPYRALTRRLRAVAGGTPIVAVGRIATPAEAEALLADGDADAVMLGRAMIADAGWAAKARTGRAGEIRLCIGCNACWGTITDGRPIACTVNPRLGTADELDWRPPPAGRRRRVVVVGAGLAGLAAAATAARRGHEVTLLGASPDPGGAMRLHAALPGCGQLARSCEHALREAQAAGVAFRFGARAGLADILALKPDAVVLATGSRMLRPPALAQDCGALDLRDGVRALLADAAPRVDRGVLFDQDHTAGTYDAAELMAARFPTFLLLTPREAIARDVPLVVRLRVERRIHGAGIAVVPFAELVGFAGTALAYRHVHTGEVTRLNDVAMLAFSTPRVPDDALLADLQAHGIAAHRAGDCRVPRAAMAAIQEGQDAGLAV